MRVFDRRLPPVTRVLPGEKFVVETEDSRSGQARTEEAVRPEALIELRRRGFFCNPATGPIFVEGAEAGDTLAVHIHEQACDSLGYMPCWPWLFHLEDFLPEPATVFCPIRDGQVIFNDDIRIPARPMIGVLGTAPALEAISTASMGRHGGNLDVPEICAGSTVYLPVEVEGALLGLGDCHAIQSDGELNEVEMRSVVTLSCDVIKGRSPVMTWPRIETADQLVTVAVACPLEEALRLALRDMILWVEELTGLSKRDAYLLIGIAGHARPGQAQVSLYSMRCLMPKKHLPALKCEIRAAVPPSSR